MAGFPLSGMGMLTVLIETKDHEEALARTLASLVGAAVEGIVRDVLVCDLGSGDQTHYVAEHAGCHYIDGGVMAGVRQARGEWLLLLEPGARMVEGWTDSVLAHTARATTPVRFSRARDSRGPFLLRIFQRRKPLAEGLLVTKRQAMALSGATPSAEALARRLATRRIEGQIVTAPRARK